MINERTIREFLDRVAAMTPQPPNFPQEIEMTHRDTATRRPVLAVVAAAALVLVLAIPVLLLDGDETPLAGSSTTTTVFTPSTSMAVTTTTPSATTTPSEDPTSTTAPVSSVWSRPVFLVTESANSFLGNPTLVPIWLEVHDESGGLSPEAHFTEVLSKVEELPFDNAIPEAVQIVELTVIEYTDGEETWVAGMNEAFVAGAGGLLADVTMLNQLVYTITHASSVDRVLFTVNGDPIEAYGIEGIVLDEPVSREDFIDELALIFVTEPIIEQDGVYRVVGTANTFEATLTVRVVSTDGESGEVAFEQSFSATCGSGCWGMFEAEIDAELVTPGLTDFQLLTYSANDGSPENIVTIPIPEGGIWVLDASR